MTCQLRYMVLLSARNVHRGLKPVRLHRYDATVMGTEVREPVMDGLQEYFVESDFISHLSLLFLRDHRVWVALDT